VTWQEILLSAQGTTELALVSGRNTLRQSHSPESCLKLLRKIGGYADKQVAQIEATSPDKVDCKPGCCFCCYRPVFALVPEILAAFAYINENFSDEEKLQLRERLNAYIAEADRIEGTRRLNWTSCPLLVNGLCTIYDARPMTCRGIGSLDVEVCKLAVEFPEDAIRIPQLKGQPEVCQAALEGFRQATGETGLVSGVYDLGRCLKLLFDDPEAAEEAVTGRRQLPPLPGVEPPRQFPVRAGEAHGISVPDPMAAQIRLAFEQGSVPPPLIHPTAAQLWATLALPKVYETQDELLEHRARFDRTLNELLERSFDPVEMFNALSAHHTFGLAYQGLSVKETLQNHGQLLVERIAKRALPHLSEPLSGARKPGKIRVGYASSGLYNFNGTRWALGWLQNHAPDLERYAFHMGNTLDVVTSQFKAASDHFFHLTGSVQGAAEFIKSLDLDVLIFPDLGMNGTNYQFASLRLARVQCTAWGHPVTSGLPTIDYYLSSELMEPLGADSEYTEKLVRLPGSGLYYKNRPFPKSAITREQLGLPAGFLVVMGQYLPKWTPWRDHLLKRIYDITQEPLVFIERPNAAALTRRLEKIGVKYKLLSYLTDAQYNRLLELADVSLDPPDWSGGNTTIVALASGTPVVTLPGAYMRGRHSLAFNHLANLGRLVAADEADFVQKVTTREWLAESLVGGDPDALFEDGRVTAALDDFLQRVAQ